VSMAFNFTGYPIGAALAGAIAVVSIDAAILVGAVAAVLAGLLAAVMIPRRDVRRSAGMSVRTSPESADGIDVA